VIVSFSIEAHYQSKATSIAFFGKEKHTRHRPKKEGECAKSAPLQQCVEQTVRQPTIATKRNSRLQLNTPYTL
jgi:hypothetical protein